MSTRSASPTSLLLLESQLLPVNLHAISKGHPEISLLLGGHGLPSLLNVGEGGVGDGVCLAGLDKGCCSSSGDRLAKRGRGRTGGADH